MSDPVVATMTCSCGHTNLEQVGDSCVMCMDWLCQCGNVHSGEMKVCPEQGEK